MWVKKRGGGQAPPEPGDPVEPVDPSDPSINTAGGGGLYTEGGPVAVTRSEFTGNSASEEGGGFANAPDNDLVIRNSLLLRNVARRPGLSEDGDIEEGGHGGGFFSLADGDALIDSGSCG